MLHDVARTRASARDDGNRTQGDRKTAGRGSRSPVDLEAIGLVLLAVGGALAALTVPVLPTAAVGALVQGAINGRVGVGAYVLPWPLLVLGGFFLARRAPPGWIRVLVGYYLTALSAWTITALLAPPWTGAWGTALATQVVGALGLAVVAPAVVAVTIGIDLLAGWRPTTTVRVAARRAWRATRHVARVAWQARTAARKRAAFRADVALVRIALKEQTRDLAILADAYPTSAELARWSERVDRQIGDLRRVDAQSLDEARDEVGEARTALQAFVDERCRELRAQVRAEGVREFSAWASARREDLGVPFAGSTPLAAAFDEIRKALALDLTAVESRYARLVRERERADATLGDGVRARDLVEQSDGHAQRRAAYVAVAEAAEVVERDVESLDAWRVATARASRETLPIDLRPAIDAVDARWTEEVRRRGRSVLPDVDAWQTDRDAVVSDRHAASLHDGTADVDASTADANAPVEPVSDAAGSHATVSGTKASDVSNGDSWTTVPAPSRPTVERTVDGLPHVGAIDLQLPPLDLLDPLPPRGDDPDVLRREVEARVRRIDETLANFRLEGRVVDSVRGPSVTRFEVEPAPGEKIARFANLADDLALAMAASSVRIEAPIPGKSVIGLEVPNGRRDVIRFRESVESATFARARARLPLILGKSIDGEMMVGDLAKMPHLLIAGSTGSGKSVAVNTLIASLAFKFLPTELRFLMIDPKMVELTPYDGIPHLIRPVVTNPSDAAGVLLGAVAHMERRYKMMSRIGAKNLDQYNEKAAHLDLPQLPFVVIVIDELADLMITSPKEVESAIMRLAQMARATGMHLVLATQRPSVDILTALIKVNVPARAAFAVSSGHDSRTILDAMGAERLVGNGDMLYYQPGLVKPVRLQGPFVSEDEIAAVAGFLRRQFFEDEFVEAYGSDFEPVAPDDSEATGFIDWNDDKLRVAAEIVIAEGQASVSRLQRRLQVGHARAGKLMDSLEALGVVGPHMGSKPRDVLVTLAELPNVFGK